VAFTALVIAGAVWVWRRFCRARDAWVPCKGALQGGESGTLPQVEPHEQRAHITATGNSKPAFTATTTTASTGGLQCSRPRDIAIVIMGGGAGENDGEQDGKRGQGATIGPPSAVDSEMPDKASGGARLAAIAAGPGPGSGDAHASILLGSADKACMPLAAPLEQQTPGASADLGFAPVGAVKPTENGLESRPGLGKGGALWVSNPLALPSLKQGPRLVVGDTLTNGAPLMAGALGVSGPASAQSCSSPFAVAAPAMGFALGGPRPASAVNTSASVLGGGDGDLGGSGGQRSGSHLCTPLQALLITTDPQPHQPWAEAMSAKEAVTGGAAAARGLQEDEAEEPWEGAFAFTWLEGAPDPAALPLLPSQLLPSQFLPPPPPAACQASVSLPGAGGVASAGQPEDRAVSAPPRPTATPVSPRTSTSKCRLPLLPPPILLPESARLTPPPISPSPLSPPPPLHETMQYGCHERPGGGMTGTAASDARRSSGINGSAAPGLLAVVTSLKGGTLSHESNSSVVSCWQRLTREDVQRQLRLVPRAFGGLLGRGATSLVYKALWPGRFGPQSLLAVKVKK
jgi:hypothetical protein